MPARLVSRIPEIIAENPVRAKELSLLLAEEIASGARGRAPVFTGTLRDSIEAESVTGGAAVHAIWYYFLVEWGTVNTPAQPFLIPALEAAYASVFQAGRKAFAEL